MASLGQALKEEREARNISIEEIASATKIVPRYIEALENDRFDLMPGGFFVKAIIRTYARAVGLNEDDVLAKYRAAGALGEPERKRPLFSKYEPAEASRPVSSPPPTKAPAHEAAAPPPPPPPTSPSPDTTQILVPPKPEPEPELSFLPAPKAPMDPAKKKRIVSWVVGGLLLVLAVALVIILWPSGGSRPGPAREDAPPPSSQAQTAAPPPKQTAAAPGTEPPPENKPEPVVEEVWTGVTIEITFEAETWIQVYADGVLKVDGLFPPGAKARAQAAERLLIHVGNAGGFSFLLNGKPAKPLGRAGQVITDIKITPDNVKDFLRAVGSPGPPAG